jgi:hypothetical protein
VPPAESLVNLTANGTNRLNQFELGRELRPRISANEDPESPGLGDAPFVAAIEAKLPVTRPIRERLRDFSVKPAAGSRESQLSCRKLALWSRF